MHTAHNETLVLQQPTQIEAIVAERFDDSAWSPDEPPRFMSVSMAGLENPIGEWGERDPSRLAVADPTEAWIATIYGSRIVPDTEHPGDVKVETASLDTLHAIHQVLSETVLAGENIHISTPTTPPEPELSINSEANNTLWLEMIANRGEWPIMATGRTNPDGSPEYTSHDYADFHNLNMATFPRELQDLASATARTELAWMRTFEDGEEPRPLMLTGDRRDHDPFASGFRGAEGHTNGIDKVDNLTDVKDYVHVLQYAMQGPEATPEERMQALADRVAEGNLRVDDPNYHAQHGLLVLKRLIADAVNYNTRHQTRQNATPEAIDAFIGDSLTGIARVAHKFLGTYVEQ